MNEKHDVPYIVHEGIVTRLERTIEKLWILCIILIILLVGSNGAWLYYQSQFEETTTVQQEVDANADDGSDLNLTTVGGDYHGGESENKTDNNKKENTQDRRQ